MDTHKFQDKPENNDQINTSGNITPFSSDFYESESHNQQKSCPECQGIGWVYGEDNETCILCNGRGLL